MAFVDKFNVGGVQYNVKDTGTAKTVAEQAQTITQQGKTITQQGQTIAQQGQTITQQGQAIADIRGELTGIVDNVISIIDVSKHGAVGDGTTDNTAAIQKCLDEGGYIFIPNGTFKIANSLNVHSNTVIFGSGTILLDSTSSQDISAIRIVGTAGNHVTNVVVRDITVAGVKSNPGIKSGIHIWQALSSELCVDSIYLEYLTVKNFNHRGINTFAGGAGDGFDHAYPKIYVSHCSVTGCGETPFCNSGVQICCDDIFLSNTGCRNEEMTVDNGCLNSQFNNFTVVDDSHGGAGLISIDECRQSQFTNFSLETKQNNLPLFRCNCQSGNVDNIFINNFFGSGGNSLLSMGTNEHPAQVIASNLRHVNAHGKGITAAGSGVLLVTNGWFDNFTRADSEGLPLAVKLFANCQFSG